MKFEKIRIVILTLTFVALVFAGACVALPYGIGNINLGDGMILLCAILLGPIPALIAGVAGAALADLSTGYLSYIPITILMKAAIAILFWLMMKALIKKHPLVQVTLSGIAAEAVAIIGYLIYEATFKQLGAGAFANVPANLIQALLAIGIAIGVYAILKKAKLTRQLESSSAVAEEMTGIVLEEAEDPETTK